MPLFNVFAVVQGAWKPGFIPFATYPEKSKTHVVLVALEVFKIVRGFKYPEGKVTEAQIMESAVQFRSKLSADGLEVLAMCVIGKSELDFATVDSVVIHSKTRKISELLNSKQQ